MVRVFDVTEFYSMRGGGIRSHLESKNQVLCQHGVSHKILAPGPRSEQVSLGPTAELELLAGPRMPYDPSYYLLWRADRVARSIAEFAPEVLEVHSPYISTLSAFLAQKSSQIRTMVWHSDHIGTYLDPWLRPRLGARSRAVLAPLWSGLATTTRLFDRTFVASRSQYELLRDHGAERIEHLPFGVDRRSFHPAQAAGDHDDNDDAPKTVIAVGRMALEKRWDLVLRAFALAAKGQPSWRLLALGDGPERPALEQLARSLLPAQQVQFAGFVDRGQLALRLQSADVFLHACPHETFGLAVAEALASGLCAVVPDRGGASEWSHEPRVRAFGNDSAPEAAAHLRHWLSLSRRQRRELPAPEVPSVEDHFERLLEHYRELLRHKRRA